MTRILIALIGFYKRWLSPALHTVGVGGCRFQPTCSEYAVCAIALHGPLRGSALALWRLLRCHPFSRGGLDQVPPPRASRAEHALAALPSPANLSQPGSRSIPTEPLP